MDFDKQGSAAVNVMTLIQQLEGKVREKNQIIVDLREQCMVWRTKFILSTMLNWANPFPLITGGVVGWLVTWLVMRRG